MSGYWEELERPGPDSFLTAAGREFKAGSRVRLHPRAGGDILDLALAGREAVIEAIEQDLDGEVTLAVVVDDDPGRDLGYERQPGHRFFFSPAEVEPVDVESACADSIGSPAGAELPAARKRILVAGIGNVFLADDGFGVALADRLARREQPPGVEVVDYGIRGMDLAYALQDGYDAVVMLDATPRGEAPGTLYVIEVQTDPEPSEVAVLETHGMDPAKVLALVGTLGGAPAPRTFVVGCEPQTRMTGDEEEIVAQLSEPVRAALAPAVRLVESLLADIRGAEETHQQEVPRR
jgi:hydrogenase maturation protease